MVNAFFVHTMEVTTATMNLKEFTYGILRGYMERYIDEDGKKSPKHLEVDKKNRAHRAKIGKGP